MKTVISQFLIAFAIVLTFTISPAHAQTPTASFDVGSIYVDQYGSGDPALILIPGLTDSTAVWNGTIARFSPSHKIYAVTLGGFGGRPAPAAPLLDRADTDITALITQQNITRPVLIGHSMGGFLALRLAAEHSNLFRGVVSVDGTPVLPGYENMTQAQRSAAAAQLSGPIRSMTAAQLEAAGRQMMLPYLTQARNLDAVAAAGHGADPTATAEYFDELYAADLRPQLSNIAVPLLELMPFDATLDPNNPQTPWKTVAQKQQYYMGLLANAKTVKIAVVNDSRHFIMYDQPQQFYTLVQNFLGNL
jgi:pimeloyl-ACP methyl ester carboxylesterase